MELDVEILKVLLVEINGMEKKKKKTYQSLLKISKLELEWNIIAQGLMETQL